ncbi:hypothetical protein CBR_g49180 [Chara braunii]|uniref:Protein kinase domain-containing protein n=1 Tax=Chara braunii TaxID=69332 RepID=A0A388M4I6_CHABU|nr:hypothetical protein CBR_g49180 [Chara braunii]|eukprot:GBG89389.1 hypothetical protein CBR_g49180 [Chara braunii]
MAVFSLHFTVVAVSVLLVIWVTAAAAAASASPSCALSPPPSSSLPRRVQRGGGYSAGDGRRSLGFERGKLLREEDLSVNWTMLNTTIFSGSTELIRLNAILLESDPGRPFASAMALSPPPTDDSLFFITRDRIYKFPLDAAPGQRNATLIAGPWIAADNSSSAGGMAMEDPDLAGSGPPQRNGSSRGRRIIHVADCGNFALRAFELNGTELFSRNYSEDIGLRCLDGLAIDSARGVLYATSMYDLYRVNLTSKTLSYRRVERWIGPQVDRLDVNADRFMDSPVPLGVRFNGAFINSQAISENGQLMYVADFSNGNIRRIRTATGAVDTIAGSRATRTQKTGASEEGPVLLASFAYPGDVALTRDGCNLFVSEWGGDLRLVQLNSTGDAVQVITVASMGRGNSSTDLVSLALSPNEDRLYVATYDTQIMELGVKREALFSCGAPPPPPVTPDGNSQGTAITPPDGSSQVTVVIVATVTVSVALLLLVVGTLIAIRRRRGRGQWVIFSKDAMKRSLETTSREIMTLSETGDSGHSSAGGQPGVLVRPSSVLKQYSWEELAKACDGFSPSRLVGKGGAAEVYRGEIAGGQRVAIKMMKGAEFSETRFRQFQAELDVLATLRHMHLCSIIGYGAHQSKSFIVYPFVEGGTLYDCLQGAPPEGDARPERGPLRWKARLSVARQVAKALRYLHEEVDPPVIHRDVKSKNVLLEFGGHDDSAKIRAYLSDFGLAKLGHSAFSSTTPPLLAGAQPPGNMTNIDIVTFDTTEYAVTRSGDTIQTVNVAGTRGYMAPEYMRSCWLTYKNDVYAFGVILLELITGRKAFGRMDVVPGQQQDARNGTEGIPEALTFWAKRTLRSLDCLSSSEEEEGSRTYTGTGVAPTASLTRKRAYSMKIDGVQELADPQLESLCMDRTRTSLRSKASTKRAYSMKMNGGQQLADPQVESIGGYDRRGMAAVLQLAMECVRTNPKRRPNMGEVLERLNRAEDGR